MDQPARPRIVGIDVARGIAVLGMFTAHLGNKADVALPNGGSMLEAFDGRSAAGFALLAGVSAALLSGGDRPYRGPRLTHARVRVLGRAAVLWPLGAVMIALGTPAVVILPTYAVLFAVTAGLLHLRPRTLGVVALSVAIVAPPVVVLVRDRLFAGDRPVQLVDITLGHYYPAAVWLAYLVAGLAVGRLDLHSSRTRAWMLGLGVTVAGAGLVTNAVAMRTVDLSHSFRLAMLTTRPHSSSPVEVLTNIGVVVAVLAVCLVLADRFPRTVAPLAATGALALTAYCGHLVAIAVLGRMVVFDPSNVRLAVFVVVTVAVAWGWRAALGRGPLERVLHEVSTAVADAVVPEGRRPAHPAPAGPAPDGPAPDGPAAPGAPEPAAPGAGGAQP